MWLAAFSSHLVKAWTTVWELQQQNSLSKWNSRQMVLNHWNSSAYAECSNSSMNNRKLSTNMEKNSRCVRLMLPDLHHTKSYHCQKCCLLLAWESDFSKSQLMKLFLRNASIFKYCTSACCCENWELTWTDKQQLQ